MDSDEHVGRRLIAVREHLKFNQVGFAVELNLAKSTLNGYETGSRQLSLETAKRIRDRYGVSLDWLLYGDVGQPGYELAVKLGPNPKISEDAKKAPAPQKKKRA
jgi:transcriptional regulator with XRE-family HTH domain